jgi:hypothetical protein
MLSRLVILSGRKSKDARLAPQLILLDVAPYLIMEWGKVEARAEMASTFLFISFGNHQILDHLAIADR